MVTLLKMFPDQPFYLHGRCMLWTGYYLHVSRYMLSTDYYLHVSMIHDSLIQFFTYS